MRRFLCNLGGFGAIQATVLAVLLVLYPGQDNTYLAATIDKHRAAESATGERILIVGGSNVSFGIDSPALHRELGRRPVNLGLHAGLGLDFMLSEARHVMRPGDAVLLNLEYEHLLEDVTDLNVMQLLEYRPESVAFMSWAQRMRLVDQGLIYLRKVIGKATKSRDRDRGHRAGYARAEFNEYGDVIGHRNKASHYVLAPTGADFGPIDSRFVESAIEKLNRFARECRDRQVAVFYFHPAIAQTAYEAARGPIAYVDQAVRSGVQMPVLNRAAEMVYPDGLFYDTHYHLLLEGTQRKTALIIDRLAGRLARPPSEE